MSEILETSSHRLHHRVRVIHGGTGEPFDRIRVRLEEGSWSGWRLERRGPDVLLSTDEAIVDRRPAQTRLEISVPAEIRPRFADCPPSVEEYGDPVRRVALDRDDHESVVRELEPAPSELVVEVRKPAGGPVTGATVEARATGDTAALTEELADGGSGTGTYRSEIRSWRGNPKPPYEIFVNDQECGAFRIDHLSAETRLRVIDQ